MFNNNFYKPKLVENIFSTNNNLPPFEIYVQRTPPNYDIYIVFNDENAILQKGLSFNTYDGTFTLGEKFTLLTELPHKLADYISKIKDETSLLDVNDNLNALKTKLINAIGQITEGEKESELTNLKTELENGQNTYTLDALQSIERKLDHYSNLRVRAEKIQWLLEKSNKSENTTSVSSSNGNVGESLANLTTVIHDFYQQSLQSTNNDISNKATEIHSKILDVIEQLERNPTQSEKLNGLSEELNGLSEELTTLRTEADGENTTEQQTKTKEALINFINNLQKLIKMYQEIINTKI